jgi:hypothetical protein
MRIILDKRVDYLRQEGVNVLDAVRFADDDVLEHELLEGGLLDEADLVARHTSKSWGMSRFAIMSARSSFVPVRTKMLTSEVHCLNSRAQFWRVDLGTTMRCGSAIPRLCFKYARKEIV